MTQHRRRRRPTPLPEPATYYDRPDSKYPEECERKAAGDGDLASGMLTEICDRCPLLKL